ncbi:MAG: CBS domain-containing protein [Acidimicrobiales bacterium]|jgi:CBS domain-containing protein/sporulation protein YlmC with PRC-barrel domain
MPTALGLALMATDIIHLSGIVHSPLLGSDGGRIGRVEDVIALSGEQAHPPVTGIVARIGRRELFVPAAMIASVEVSGVQLQGETLNLARFERRPGELLLTKDLSGRHLINIVGARLIRANEIEIALVDGKLEVIGVDPTSRPLLRRLLPRALAQRIGAKAIVDWESIQPFVSHVPTAMLRIPYRKLARLHPAQIADLVEAASHEEGEEIINAVGQDVELEADVFEELDTDHQLEFLSTRTDKDAARLLATMEPDDAADLIADLEQDRRLSVLEALPQPTQAKVRALLSYNPETAGGLMSPEFLALPGDSPVSDALEEIRRSPVAPEALGVIYTLDADGRLSGTASVVRLLKSPSAARIGEVSDLDPVAVRADADLHAIVRKMSDFNLVAAPVIDDDHRMIGVVTVDDVLELLLPTGWKRDFGMTTADE